MRTRAALLVVGVLASATAAADGTFSRADRANQAPAAALYFQVPLGTRGEQQGRPTFGLRVQQGPLAQLHFSPLDRRQAKTILDVPFRARQDDPLRDSGASTLLGTGMIVGIVVGAVVAVAVLSDDDDGDGGGY